MFDREQLEAQHAELLERARERGGLLASEARRMVWLERELEQERHARAVEDVRALQSRWSALAEPGSTIER